jgi:D-lyxose ketol-isomerase
MIGMALAQRQYEDARKRTLEFFKKASIVITDAEKETLEVSDFGLGRLDEVGVELVIYASTDRCSAKEVVLFPNQICPDHRHPPIGEDNPGKEETFRCRWGEVYLYVEGPATPNPKATVPEDMKPYFTVWHEVILKPGDQYMVPPNVSHWFQAGPEGAVLSEFSTKNVDEADIFVDPSIKRITELV